MNNRLEASSNSYFELLSEANQSRQIQDHQLAVNVYNHMIEQFGKSIELIRILAHCYFLIGLSEENESAYQSAIQLMMEAIELDPNNDQFHLELAQFLDLGTVRYEEAAQEYRVAIKLNSINIQALLGGTSLYGVPEEVVTLDEAINWLERVIDLEPNNPTHHIRLGEFYYEKGQTQKSKEECAKALLCPMAASASNVREVLRITDNEI